MEDDLVQKAKLDEQAERYDDMAVDMKALTHIKKLGNEERNLLSVAYKNVVGPRRASYRVITGLLRKCEEDDQAGDCEQNERKKEIIRSYQKTIREELDKICREVQVRFSVIMARFCFFF